MRHIRLTASLFTLGLTATLLAGGLPRLPRDRALPQGEGSPGVVTFRHASHLDASKPDCTTCHPALFSILPPSRARTALSLKHAEMEKGAACGKCHDGKSAHSFEDCATCHEVPKER
jgi:c(7)-type cytochrome triheme protein